MPAQCWMPLALPTHFLQALNGPHLFPGLRTFLRENFPQRSKEFTSFHWPSSLFI